MIKPYVIRHATEEAWLADKAKYIGASESASLFGHGFLSYFRLYHQKAGTLDAEDLSDNVPVQVGRLMEAGFADVIRQIEGHDLRKSHRYLVYGEARYRLACSLDYELRTEDAGWVPAELKILDWASFKEDWEEQEVAGEYDPPLKYGLQLQHQLLVTGKPYGYLFALVGNKQVVTVKMEADEGIQRLILEAADKFWNEIASNMEPRPDYDTDLQAMYYVLTNVDDGREVHWHDDEWAESAMLAYKEAGEREKAAKQIKDSLRAEILDRMGPAIRAKLNGGTISAKLTERYGKQRRELRITPKRS